MTKRKTGIGIFLSLIIALCLSLFLLCAVPVAVSAETVNDISDRVGRVESAEATAKVEAITGKTVAEVGNAMKARYATLKEERNLGTDSSGVKEWDGYVFQDFYGGDSTAMFDWGARGKNYFGLCYSVAKEEVFYIADGYAVEFEKLGGSKKTKLGEMLSDSGASLQVGDETWTLQLFENGYIRKDGDTFATVSGVTYNETNKSFVKIPTLTSDYGAKKGAAFTIGDKTYQNFENGYAEYYLLGEDYVVRNYANRNINSEGEATFVAKEVYAASTLSANIGENAAQKATVLNTTEKTEEEVRVLFADAFERAVASGYGLGVPASPIKIWNNLIIMDFKTGDGKFSFGGDRVSMSFIVYNPAARQAFAVCCYSVEFVNNELFPYGLPKADVKKNGSFTTESGNVSYAFMQEFENGLIYTTADGLPVGEKGLRYDAETEMFVSDVAPTVPKQYGAEQNRSTVDSITYIDYEKGCVTAVRSAEGYCTYTLHPGRNFDSDKVPQLLPLNSLIKKSDLLFDTSVDYGIEIETLRTAIYDEITAYYNAGYFLGFLEDRFKPWNDIDAQQFIWGDSSADPFKEEGRRHVAALALNKQTEKLCLMRDGVLDVWQENYSVLGFPKANGKYYADQGIMVQEFDSGFIVTDGLQSYAKTGIRLENFLEKFSAVKVPTHEKDESKGYIAEGSVVATTDGNKKNGCAGVIGGSVSAAAVIVLALGVVLIVVKRRKAK